MEVEFGGVKFAGGRMFAVITALTTLVGALYGAFEVYKDYTDMKQQIQEYVAPDLSGIEERISVVNEKMDGVLAEVKVMKESMNETADRVGDIKGDLREDMVRLEKIVDEVEDQIKAVEDDVRKTVQNAEERFENKRDALQNDYEAKADSLRSSNDQRMTDLESKVDRDLKELESTLTNKLQKALDNPLAN